MATTAPLNAGGGNNTTVKTGNNETNQKNHQKKRRNRPKKKKGKGAGGTGDDDDGGGAPGQRCPTAQAGVNPRQKPQHRNAPPTQQRQQQQPQLQPQSEPQPRQLDRGQRHRNKTGNPRTPAQRPSQATSTAPSHPTTAVPPSTTVSTVPRRAPAPVRDIAEPTGTGRQDVHATMKDSNIDDSSSSHGQALPSSRVATGTSAPRLKARTEADDAAANSVTLEKDAVKGKETTVTNDIAPFECSWTTISNGMRPTGEEDGTNCSERSFQSFQEGEISGQDVKPNASKSHTSNTVSPQQPKADQQTASGSRGQAGQNDEQVGSTAAQNEKTLADVGGNMVGGVEDHEDESKEMKSGGSGEPDSMLEAGHTRVHGVVADAATCRHSAVGEHSTRGCDLERISETKKETRQVQLTLKRVSSPTTKPQQQGRGRGAVPKPDVGCKANLGGHRKEDTPISPAKEALAKSRRALGATDEGGEDLTGGANVTVSGMDNAEDVGEKDALLLPDTPPSQDSHNKQGGGRLGLGRGSSPPKTSETVALSTAAETATAAEEQWVDDIDDESTTLLERSPVGTASNPKFNPPLASTSTTTGAVRASGQAPAKGPPTSSSASSPPGGVKAEQAPSLPAATPPPPPPAAPATVAATTFNYYELPAVPEDAPEASEQPSDRGRRTSEPSTGNIQQPSLARVQPAEEQKKLSGIWAAVRRSDTAGVRAQLAAGTTLDEADSEGRTPLMVACAAGDTEMVSLLVKGVSPPSSVAARTIEGWTPLMIASGGGRLGVVKVLLEAGAAIHDKDDEFGSNSFMWACGGGHSDIVRFMLDHGAKELLQSVNSDMWTPLMVACDAGSLATVQVLVEAGADLGAFNRDVQTAMDIAAGRNHLLVECYLRTEGAFSAGQFWSAADTGDAPMISRLLRGNGHLVAALDADGRTALLRSCVGGHLEAARVLVEAGADVDFRDSSGTSALSISTVLGDVALTRYLVQIGGARLTVKNNAGWTPLMQAVAKGDLIMTRYLVDRGAAVNDGNPGGESVLDMAKRFSGAELQRYLAAKGGFSSQAVRRQIGEVNHGGRGLFRFW